MSETPHVAASGNDGHQHLRRNPMDDAATNIESARAIVQRVMDDRITVDRDYRYSDDDGPLLRGALALLAQADAIITGECH